MKETYRIFEYGSFVREKQINGYVSLKSKVFDALENFILSNVDENDSSLDLMGISVKKGAGKVITAKNYVGIISMKDGTSIEILPKVFSKKHSADSNSEEIYVKSKKLLIDMIKTLNDSPYKTVQMSNLSIANINVFEIFIRMFINEVFFIAKKGLKSGYETVQSNENFFKGKMKFKGQIRYNYVHKERSYVEYDEFNLNRAENKIIKATLNYLYKISGSVKNKNDIKTLLYSFNDVDESMNYEDDFRKIIPDRNTKEYETALRWSKVFLHGKSFTSYSGSEIAIALLFPMETLFENYVAAQLRKVVSVSEYKIALQDKSKHLFNEPKRFQMRPDILLTRKNDKKTYVMDTKWKLLSSNKPNYGISQADMYQMYAYQKKFDSENVTLIYPYTEAIPLDEEIQYAAYDNVMVRVVFVDLFDIKNSLINVVQTITE